MNNTLEKQKLIKFFENEPLFVNGDSIREFNLNIIEKNKSNIFIGIGLCTRTDVSDGIPFDILGMILPAERLRNRLNLNRVLIQIADIHAVSNNLLSWREIEAIANNTKTRLTRVLENLKLENFKIFKASENNKNKFIKDIEDQVMKNIKATNDYIRNEVLDIEFLRKNFDASIKLSWIIPGEENRGTDERLFDNLHKEIFGTDINFLHLKPGHTFDKKHWRVSPYIHVKGQNRILLRKNENVKEKFKSAEKIWKDKALGGARNHLKNIVRCYESLFGNLFNMTLEEKIKFIINQSLR